MTKPMPIGVDDFAEARQNYYFVDKTKFISDFWMDHAKVTLITRPRRFGKTMTQSMLYYFFTNENAAEHRKLFRGLAVSKDAAVMAEQGKYPVVFLTLKDAKKLDWKQMFQRIQTILQRLYETHLYLMKSDKLSEEDKAYFLRVYRREENQEDAEDALRRLMDMLMKHYGQPVVLLLDEYDVPIQQAWEHHYYEQGIAFMRSFLTSALKTNPSLEFAVLTGVLRIAKESIFSDLNNLSVASLVNGRYPGVMGFTSEEVEAIAKEYGREDKLPEIKQWYDGYHFAGKEIYNPWSVVNYFANDCQPDFYWVNTSGNVIIREMVQHADERTQESLRKVVEGKSIRAYLNEGFIYSDIYKNRDALYTMLLTTGYLTPAKMRRTSLGVAAELRIPNQEILSIYRNEIIQRFHDFSTSDLEDLMLSMLDGDVRGVQEGLQYYLKAVASNFDAAGKESFYHGFVLGMTAYLVPDYEVRSNRESGLGRYDIAVFPKEKGKNAVILEFKIADKPEQMKGKAEEALSQIAERDYMTEFCDRGITTVHQYGIAFCGKSVLVMMNRK